MPLKLSGATSGTITVDTPAAAGTNTLVLPAKTGNIITSADSATVTQAMLGANVAANGPAFGATAGTPFSAAHVTFTKATFGAEEFDTNNNYASDRFTPTVAGYYQISACIQYQGTASASVSLGAIYKNGSNYAEGGGGYSVTFAEHVSSALVYMNGTTDYVEVYCYQSAGSTQTMCGRFFFGSLVRAA